MRGEASDVLVLVRPIVQARPYARGGVRHPAGLDLSPEGTSL